MLRILVDLFGITYIRPMIYLLILTETLSNILVLVCTIILGVVGWLIIRVINAKDEKDKEQDVRLTELESKVSANKGTIDVITARDDLKLGPIQRELYDIKANVANMVTKEAWNAHKEELTEFKKEFRDHTKAHQGIKEYVDQRLSEIHGETKRELIEMLKDALKK